MDGFLLQTLFIQAPVKKLNIDGSSSGSNGSNDSSYGNSSGFGDGLHASSGDGSFDGSYVSSYVSSSGSGSSGNLIPLSPSYVAHIPAPLLSAVTQQWIYRASVLSAVAKFAHVTFVGVGLVSDLTYSGACELTDLYLRKATVVYALSKAENSFPNFIGGIDMALKFLDADRLPDFLVRATQNIHPYIPNSDFIPTAEEWDDLQQMLFNAVTMFVASELLAAVFAHKDVRTWLQTIELRVRKIFDDLLNLNFETTFKLVIHYIKLTGKILFRLITTLAEAGFRMAGLYLIFERLLIGKTGVEKNTENSEKTEDLSKQVKKINLELKQIKDKAIETEDQHEKLHKEHVKELENVVERLDGMDAEHAKLRKTLRNVQLRGNSDGALKEVSAVQTILHLGGRGSQALLGDRGSQAVPGNPLIPAIDKAFIFQTAFRISDALGYDLEKQTGRNILDLEAMFVAAVVSAQKLYGYKNIIGRSLQSAVTNINHVREITSEVWSELKKILIITTATVLGKTHAYLAGGLAQATGQNLALQAVQSTAQESIQNAAVDSIQNAAQNTVPEVLDVALFYSIETLATRALRVGKYVANTAEEHNIPVTPDFIKKVAGHPYVTRMTQKVVSAYTKTLRNGKKYGASMSTLVSPRSVMFDSAEDVSDNENLSDAEEMLLEHINYEMAEWRT